MKATVADYATRVLCLRIEPTTGSAIRLAQYPRDLTMSNATVYLTGSGYEFTGYSADSGMAPAMVDLDGIIGAAGLTEAMIESGLLDGARCYLFATSWATPVEDEEPIVASILGKATIMDSRYRIEEMALIDALNQTVGATYTAQCPKVFGGQEYAGCGIALGPITVTGTISHVTSTSVVRDSTRAEAADYFGAGSISFSTGANAGLPAREIKSYAADGTVTVFQPFDHAVVVGDAYTLVPGCRKRQSDCRDKWSNIANFGGFSFVPVGSQYGQVGTR